MNWGDGSAPSSVSLTDRSFSLTHTYATADLYTVTVTIADDDSSTSRTHSVTVTQPTTGLSEAIRMIDELVASRKMSRQVGACIKAHVDCGPEAHRPGQQPRGQDPPQGAGDGNRLPGAGPHAQGGRCGPPEGAAASDLPVAQIKGLDRCRVGKPGYFPGIPTRHPSVTPLLFLHNQKCFPGGGLGSIQSPAHSKLAPVGRLSPLDGPFRKGLDASPVTARYDPETRPRRPPHAGRGEADAPGAPGGREHPHHARGGGRVRQAAADVLDRQGLLGPAASRAQGLLPRPHPVPAVAHRHRLEVQGNDRVPRRDRQAPQRPAHRPHQRGRHAPRASRRSRTARATRTS